MQILLSKIFSKIHHQEDKLSSQMMSTAKEAYQMTLFLNEMLCTIKVETLKNKFSDEQQEIDFFKNIKPQILGKLIYYNKIFRIETTCPVNSGKIHQSYYENELKCLKIKYRDSICNENFYRYYRSGRTDRDYTYFRLGQINYHEGLNSDVFETDLTFSTYYDNKIAHIIANELLYTYLLTKISPDEDRDMVLINGNGNKDISWTNSQNALIELVYALYASNSIADRKIGIRKLALIFQVLFRTPLNDIHHSFHRMKTRAGSRTAFLDQLKISLEEYMDKNL
ncbi:tetracycline regulation of excision, RteC [Sphingobacterium sp. ML3W]|uniref:RteC domain-containing protein n=1 Tax=Sphingobacterium sp. ML3W TaxID=1538644 RepID=UPI0004F5A3D2|nr:RteC domain-containing protein [Sphingobacterium sp. ML3W]AIM37892.1 tetracycline regulation of excision, RteC [Sphingobacterium sp. ML3W]